MPVDFGVPVPPAAPVSWPDRRRWLVHGAWLLATAMSTTYVGGWHYAGFLAVAGRLPSALTPDHLRFWLDGAWFSLPVLAILGTHEAGHYLACRHYGVDASLPTFLPAPLPLTGTFGAFIRIRDRIPHRRALFDIGVAGPFAGVVVAVPVLALGLSLSRVEPMPLHVEMIALGRPLLFHAAQALVTAPVPDGALLHLHPMARAAWFGLLATALNLFPLAQFDGGHVAYAVFGTRARIITLAAAVAVVGLTFVSTSWVAWAVLSIGVLVTSGIGHPPTSDDAAPLGRTRLVLALVAALVFVGCFTPSPIEFVEADLPAAHGDAGR